MPIEFEIIDKKDWESLSADSPYSTPLHEFEWNNVTADCLGGEFYPYVVRKDNRKWLVPIFKGLNGMRDDEALASGIGYGGPLPTEHIELDGTSELESSVIILNEMRSALGLSALRASLYPAEFWPLNDTNAAVEFGSTCKVRVSHDLDDMFNNTLTGNARTAVRKSEKAGVKVRELGPEEIEDSEEALRLLNDTQLRVGSNYQTDNALFKAINEFNGLQLEAKTFVAEIDTLMVAMAYCIYNRKELFHMFNGWNRSFAKSCANQALQWHMLNHAAELQIPSYNMGESHTDDIRKAKLQWGGHIVRVPKISVVA